MMKINKTRSEAIKFLIRADMAKVNRTPTQDIFDIHEVLTWALFFAEEAGYGDHVYPTSTQDTLPGTLYT